ncbi:MAG: metallophosphoesterase [Lachnospiraceae bacterium]|nr:metallophosphoesterase [Lachnospiraceae bacterium]
MQALVISDTHGRCKNLERLLKKFQTLDLVLHLGDVEDDEDYILALVYNTFHCDVKFVRGNMDTFSREPAKRTVEFGGHKIYMTHGHIQGVGYTYDTLLREARSEGADIAMFGHTHMPHLSYENGIMLLNPGSLSKPRQDGHRPAYALLDIDQNGKPVATLCQMKTF